MNLICAGKIYSPMVEDRLLSLMILYGTPRIGKTSIANTIASSTEYACRKMNAATDGKKQ